MPHCNICGNSTFGTGPGGRKSFDGKSLPRCTKCQSLERHRALRDFWLCFPKNFFASKQVLQFSQDRSVEKKWFKSLEVSVYEGHNSIDIQNIQRSDNSYDIVNCVHVLEHIPDDRKALRELMRIVKHNGFIILAVPSPLELKKTNDWGYPNEQQHGHYRVYGQDITVLLDDVVGKDNYIQVLVRDPVTGLLDCIFVLSPSPDVLAYVKSYVKEPG